MRTITFILNPAADKKRAARMTETLEHAVGKMHHAVIRCSAYPGHAALLARNALRNSRAVIACGGDGTAHEVANELAFSDVSLGILPLGSANDFIKSLGHRFGKTYSADACQQADTVTVDLGKVSAPGKFNRYFLNSFGIGLTGRIAQKVSKTGWLRGELLYLYALFGVLLGYQPLKMHIKLITPGDVLEIDEHVFAFSVGNGRVEGGRFRIAPEAEIDDGLLDVCLLKAVPKARFLSCALKYSRGTQIFDPHVLYCKAKTVEVEIFRPETMHMDGEVFENICGKFRIDCVPGALKVFPCSGLSKEPRFAR